MSEKFTALERYQKETILFLNQLKGKPIDESSIGIVLSQLKFQQNASILSKQIQLVSIQLLEKSIDTSIDLLLKYGGINDVLLYLKSSDQQVQKASVNCLKSFVDACKSTSFIKMEDFESLVVIYKEGLTLNEIYSLFGSICLYSLEYAEKLDELLVVEDVCAKMISKKTCSSICSLLKGLSGFEKFSCSDRILSSIFEAITKELAFNITMDCLVKLSETGIKAASKIASHSHFMSTISNLLASNDLKKKAVAMRLCVSISKHGKESADSLAVFIGPVCVEYLNTVPNEFKNDCLLTIGCISAENSSFCDNMVALNIFDVLYRILSSTKSDSNIQSSSIWCLTHITKQSEEVATKCSEKGFISIAYHFLEVSQDAELQAKCERFLKTILPLSCSSDSMVCLLEKQVNPSILFLILKRLEKLLESNEERKKFLKNGHLHKLQTLRKFYFGSTSGKIVESIDKINQFFPSDVVQVCSPEYQDILSLKLDNYVADNQAREATVSGDQQ